MSAEQSARTVRLADGLDPVRALQRVLYRSAKQEPERRFHALYDKLARSDVMWRAWVDVATNQGAPGIDGISIADVEAIGQVVFTHKDVIRHDLVAKIVAAYDRPSGTRPGGEKSAKISEKTGEKTDGKASGQE